MTYHLIDGFELEKDSLSFLRRYPGNIGFPSTHFNQTGRLGGKALRVEANALLPYTFSPSVASGDLYLGMGIKLSILSPATQFNLIQIFAPGHISTVLIIIKDITNLGFRFEIRRITSTGFIVECDMDYDLDYDKWWHFELMMPLQPGNAGVTFRINNDVLTKTAYSGQSTFAGYESLEMRLNPGPAGNIIVDDWYINSLKFQGLQSQIDGLYPDKDGKQLEWFNVGGAGGHFDAIDDASEGVTDDDTTYLLSGAQGSKDKHSYSALSNLDSNIDAISIAIDGSTNSGSSEVLDYITNNDDVIKTFTIDPTTYKRYNSIDQLNPTTTKPWDVDTVYDLTTGLKIPSPQQGSGNLYAETIAPDAATKRLWLNASDVLEIIDRDGATKFIQQTAENIIIRDRFNDVKNIPLIRDTASNTMDFGLYTPLQSPANFPAEFRQAYKKEGQSIGIKVNLANPATAGTILAYDETGTAVAGTHYNITSGVSPIAVPEGATTVVIAISIPQGTKWFLEKHLVLTLNAGASTNLAVNSLTDEFRLFIRTSLQPPEVNFTDTVLSGGVGVYQLNCFIPPDNTVERANLFLKQANAGDPGAAEEGIDFQYNAAQGGPAINVPGEYDEDFPIEILAGATPGRTMVFQLDHENSNRSQENLHTWTNNWNQEEPEGAIEIWPGGDISGSPLGGNIGGGVQDSASHVSHIENYDDSVKTLPDGTPLQNIKLKEPYNPNENNFIYTRKSLRKHFNCDGPPDYHKIKLWNLVYMHVQDSTDYPAPDYVRLTLRDRGFNIVDTNEILHGEGEHNLIATFQRTGPSTYVKQSLNNSPPGSSSAYGAEVQADGSVKLWLLRHETNPTRLAKAANNVLIRPIYHVSDPPTSHDNKGLGCYWVYFTSSDTEIIVPPTQRLPDFWPKLGNWWEPRGNATTDPTRTLTFTIT